MAAKIRKGDQVIVRTGRSKGLEGEVLQVDPVRQRCLVRGVNLVKRHQRQTRTEQGGITEKEAFIALSNLAMRDPGDGKATRVGFRIDDTGQKIRYAKRSGEPLG
ncbi:MAG: 50S ribosomal protein L24 [Pseudomonadota bacterium]